MALKTKWLLSKSKSCSCTLVGVYRSLAFCPGVVVIFHGPIGCAHVASTMDLGSGFRVMADGGKETVRQSRSCLLICGKKMAFSVGSIASLIVFPM